MATDARTLPSFISTDADFQNFVAGIAAALAACGLTQTADTGQINAATVTKPAAISTSQGYQIWRFNDALQATKPIYIKVEYGSGAGSVNNPSTWWTVGTGSNGTGTLTGLVSGRLQDGNSNVGAAGGTLNSYMSGDGSRLCWVWQYDPTVTTASQGNASKGNWVIIERLRDANGVAQPDGTFFSVGSVANSPAGFGESYLFAGATLGAQQNVAAAGYFPGRGSSGIVWGGGITSFGGNVALMPLLVMCGQPRYLLSGCFYNPADISAVAQIVVNNLGANHTYLTLPSVWESFLSSNAADGFAMIWE